MTKLAAGNTGRQAKIADGDLLVHVCVGKIVRAFCHGANKDADTLVRIKTINVASDMRHGSVETEGNLTALGREVIGDGVVDDAEKFLLGVGRPDR